MTGVSLIGSALLILAAIAFCRAYKSFLYSRLLVAKEYLDFLGHVGQRIRLNGEPYSAAARSFEGEILRERGFIDLIEKGAALDEAYEKAGTADLLSEAVEKELRDCFSELGKGELESEIKKIELSQEKLSQSCRGEAEELEKRVKTAYAVSFALTLGIILLAL